MTVSQLPDSSNPPVKAQRIEWIDCAKFVAMIAVVVDHSNGLVYTNQLIATASYFSVSLFVLLSGISCWLSMNAAERTGGALALRRIKKLFLQYAFATFVILCVDRRFFDFNIYVDWILHFRAEGSFYFFAFFLQLLLVAPLLVQWCSFCNRQRTAWLWQAVTVVGLCLFACLSYKRTLLFPLLHGGGKYLFGATYLVLYYLGMLLASRGIFEGTTKQKAAILAVSAPAWIAWWLMMANGILPFNWLTARIFGKGFNPPGLTLLVFAIITLFLLYSLFSLMSSASSRPVRKLTSLMAIAGRYTLFVFMYHLLVSRLMLQFIPAASDNFWLARFFVFIPMIVLPILAAMARERIRRKVFS